MLRQALFTNARAIRSAAPIATRTTSALRAQAQLAARPVFASLPVRTARWYSSESKEGAEKKEGEAKAEEGKKEEVEDPLKKKLEAKEKEVVDLKVSSFFLFFISALISLVSDPPIVCALLFLFHVRF